MHIKEQERISLNFGRIEDLRPNKIEAQGGCWTAYEAFDGSSYEGRELCNEIIPNRFLDCKVP